jgi:hypothetical protein
LEKLTTIDQTAIAAANLKTTPSTSNSGDNLVDLLDSAAEHEKLFSELLSPSLSESNNNTNTDLLGINGSTSFDADWTAAFGNTTNQYQYQTSALQDDSTTSNNTFLPSSFLSELLTSANKVNKPTVPSPSSSSLINSKPKPTTTKKTTDKSNWLDLFAELDPIQNPDAIGKSAVDEADRNC